MALAFPFGHGGNGRRRETMGPFGVGHPGGRRHHDPSATQSGPPAQIDVLAQFRSAERMNQERIAPIFDGRGRRRRGGQLIESSQCGEQFGPDQQACTRCSRHIAFLIVLVLVELTTFHQRHGAGGAIRGQPQTHQQFVIVRRQELGSDYAGLGTLRFVQHGANGRRSQIDVVVAHQIELRPLNRREHLVGSGGKPDHLRQPFDERAGGNCGHASRNIHC